MKPRASRRRASQRAGRKQYQSSFSRPATAWESSAPAALANRASRGCWLVSGSRRAATFVSMARPYDQWSPEALGQHIGYLPQDVELLIGTIAENIARFATDPRPETIIAAAKAAGVHDLIVSMPEGYGTSIGEQGTSLSAGQAQRIALARALYGDPFLVVLDEPNSNLDAEGDEALTRAILGVRARNGIVVVVAHRPSAIAGLDLILAMNQGRQIEFGPKEETLAKVLNASRRCRSRWSTRWKCHSMNDRKFQKRTRVSSALHGPQNARNFKSALDFLQRDARRSRARSALELIRRYTIAGIRRRPFPDVRRWRLGHNNRNIRRADCARHDRRRIEHQEGPAPDRRRGRRVARSGRRSRQSGRSLGAARRHRHARQPRDCYQRL